MNTAAWFCVVHRLHSGASKCSWSSGVKRQVWGQVFNLMVKTHLLHRHWAGCNSLQILALGGNSDVQLIRFLPPTKEAGIEFPALCFD